jgi:hypothetical protein
MGERQRGKESPQEGESILSREFVEPILTVTKEFLRYHEHLGPALFLRMEAGEKGVIPLAYLDDLRTIEERREYFASLGLSVRLVGNKIREALFVSEVWFVVPEEMESLDVPPSQHPSRKEGISIVGRESKGTRFTQVLQPFSRDVNDQPIFEPLKDAKYNVPLDDVSRPSGLIDHLFG